MYNLIFGVFVGCCIVIGEVSKWIKEYDYTLGKVLKKIACCACLIGTGCLAGFLIANPILLKSPETYFSNSITYTGTPSWKWLEYILTGKNIEWDLVNSGGLSHTIISIFGICAIMIISVIGRKKLEIVISALISLICMTVLFLGNSRFLGWYYLPLIYILPLCITDSPINLMVLLINLQLEYKDVSFQIVSKCAQITSIECENEIISFVESEKKNFENYEECIYVSPGMETLKYDAIYAYTKENNQFIVISEYARSNAKIKDLYEKGVLGSDGYRFIKEQDGIAVIVYEEEKVISDNLINTM